MDSQAGSPTLDVYGNLDNSGSIWSLNLNIYGTLNNTGAFRLYPYGSVDNIGSIVNGKGGSILVAARSSVLTGSFDNSGELRMSSGGGMEVFGDTRNSGIIVTEQDPFGGGGGHLTIHGTFNNDSGGDVSLASGRATIIGSIVNNGSIGLKGGGSTLQVNHNLENFGEITTNDHVNMGDNTLMIGGRLTNEVGASFALHPDLFGPTDVANIGSVVNRGTVSIGRGMLNVTGGPTAGGSALNGFTNLGTVNISQGGTLAMPTNYIQTADRLQWTAP